MRVSIFHMFRVFVHTKFMHLLILIVHSRGDMLNKKIIVNEDKNNEQIKNYLNLDIIYSYPSFISSFYKKKIYGKLETMYLLSVKQITLISVLLAIKWKYNKSVVLMRIIN